MEVAASGSGVLKGAVDALAGAVAAAEGVCARASGLLRLVHEHLIPDASTVPEGLDARMAAFGPKGERVGELVYDSLVSGFPRHSLSLWGTVFPLTSLWLRPSLITCRSCSGVLMN